MPGTRKEVEIVVLAKDEASKTLSGIGSTLSTAIGTFAGGAALNLATAGVEKLFGAVSGGVSDARDAAKVFAQTEAVIKSTGGAAGFTADEIADMAGSLSAASGHSLFGDDDIQKGQNMLLTFTNITDQLPNTTQVMIDMATALGTDAGGAAVQLGKALNDPINGVSALSRVGVSFTEEQKAQIKTMQEAGDVSGAQAVILAELNKEFGGSAQAAADADGGMAQFNDTMGELAESIGAELLPILNEFLAWLNSPEIQAAIQVIADGLVSAFKATIEVVKQLLVDLKPVVGFVQDNLVPILSGLAAALIYAVVPAFIAWATTAATAALATITALAPVLIPIAAIGAAVGLLVAAWERDWGGIRTTLTTFWEKTGKPIFDAFKLWLDTTLTKAIDDFQRGWGIAWPAIQKAIDVAWTFMRDTVFPALKTAIEGIGTVISTLQTGWSTAWTAITTAVSTAKATISTIIGTIKDLIQGAIDRINDLITAINKIPGVDIPTIPDMQTQSFAGSRTPYTTPGMSPTGVGPDSRTTLFEPGAITIVQQPGEDAGRLAQRVIGELDRRDRLARTR